MESAFPLSLFRLLAAVFPLDMLLISSAGIFALLIGAAVLYRIVHSRERGVAAGLEERLHESSNLLNAIMYSMDEGLLVIGRDYKIILINRVASILLRAAPADMVGRDVRTTLSFFKGKQATDTFELPLDQVIEHGEIIIFKSVDENIYTHDKNGKRFPISLFLASLIVEGNREGAVVMFNDITEEKHLNDARVNFISTASHQLHTPLTGIRWFSEMLIDGDAGQLSPQQKGFVDRVYEGTLRMIALVNLLLQIARVEAGRVIIEPVPMDFKRLIEDVIMSMRPQIERKKHMVTFHNPSNPLPSVLLDKDIMWQVVQNLIDNAIRYSRSEGSIAVTLEYDEHMKQFTCRIQDSGIGVPQEQQERIFQKFFRADNAVKYLAEGSGLGLNLVKQLVEDWGGSIGFTSKENEGSTFYFTVPLMGMRPQHGEVRLAT